MARLYPLANMAISYLEPVNSYLLHVFNMLNSMLIIYIQTIDLLGKTNIEIFLLAHDVEMLTL